jgi:axial budding pattern protein 2
LPSWLHFDNRELELWGVPATQHLGETTTIRIVEKLPRDGRNSNPMAYGYVPPQEREVGRVTIE